MQIRQSTDNVFMKYVTVVLNQLNIKLQKQLSRTEKHNMGLIGAQTQISSHQLAWHAVLHLSNCVTVCKIRPQNNTKRNSSQCIRSTLMIM